MQRYHPRTAWTLKGTRESFWSLLNIHPDVRAVVANICGGGREPWGVPAGTTPNSPNGKIVDRKANAGPTYCH